MTDKKYYVYDDWFKESASVLKCPSYSQIIEAHGKGSLLLYEAEDAYQGDWVAVLVDGQRIGTVDGSFGSCSGCDILEATEDTPEAYHQLGKDYLESVRTFDSWSILLEYLESLENADYHDYTLRAGRQELIKLARVNMPLGAIDIFDRLMLDTPGSPAHEIAELAKALH